MGWEGDKELEALGMGSGLLRERTVEIIQYAKKQGMSIRTKESLELKFVFWYFVSHEPGDQDVQSTRKSSRFSEHCCR